MEFGELYEKYFKDVYLFILTISKNADVAEEITQATFFKALKEIKNFKGNCSVKSWLCQIAKNLYVDKMRKRKFCSLDEVKEKMLRDIVMKYQKSDLLGKMITVYLSGKKDRNLNRHRKKLRMK